MNWKKAISNKYLLATVAFIALLFFSDKNSILEQYKLYKQYKKAKTEHDFYATQIEQAREKYNELFSNKENLEKYAREKYLMKKANEDVYVIERLPASAQ
jgi:cell division protein FtsB